MLPYSSFIQLINSIRIGQFQDGSFYLHHTALLQYFGESFYCVYILHVMIALNLNKEYLTDNVQSFYPQQLTKKPFLSLETLETIHQV